MTRNIKKFLLGILLILAFAAASQSHQCSNYCTHCIGQNTCIECYRRRLARALGGGSVCKNQPIPPSNHCLTLGQYGCSLCQPGYVSRYVDSPNPFQCTKGATIQNCINEKILTDNSHVCFSCIGGYPSPDSSKCIPAAQVKSPIALCKVEGAVSGQFSLSAL